MSGKYTALLEKIRELDTLDMRDYGTKFKHFIFTDLRDSAFGAKAIATFLIQGGYEFALAKDRSGVVLTPTEPVATGSQRFAILQSQPLWGQPLTIGLKKQILTTYSERPKNIHGEQLRILVLDSRFKEGIDLFDVKYAHIMEEAIASSDLKQAVGRGTRYCGQRGLPFVPGIGWTLNVFIYSTDVPAMEPFTNTEQSIAAHDLMLKHSGLDLSLLTLTANLQQLAIYSAVDRPLTMNLHLGAGAEEERAVSENFMTEFQQWSWPAPSAESACASAVKPKGTAVDFTPTQSFLQQYFVPERPIKGVLAWHSVGTGKTCSAVAVASGAFLDAGYRILWVTRNSLMSDVWKNVYDSVCYMPFRPPAPETQRSPNLPAHPLVLFEPNSAPFANNRLVPFMENRSVSANNRLVPFMENRSVSANNRLVPFEENNRLRLVGGAPQRRAVSPLFMKPISYKMFQNALEKKNELGRALYRQHPEDMLYKTLLVIDEVHKLHDGDLLPSEMASFSVIQSFIWKSYQVSGPMSVRPLLMTATPISDNPASMFDILNTLIPTPDRRLMPFSDFRRMYVQPDGHITPQGSVYFIHRAEGHISYLNREHDPSTFAIPVFQTVHAGLGDVAIPGAKEVARECVHDVRMVRAKGKQQTLKQKRRSCYLKTRKAFADRSATTQKNQMFGCFRTHVKTPEFPTYTQYTDAFSEEYPEMA